MFMTYASTARHWISNLNRNFPARARLASRRGVAIIYIVVAFAVLCGLISLAADLGHAQLVKTELRRCADATAHDYMALYNTGGYALALANGPSSYGQAFNPVDGTSNIQPTVTVLGGYWDSATKAFSVSNNGGTPAVSVTVSRTKANNNAVPLMFGSLLGARSIDLSATAVATTSASTNGNLNVSATSNPYYAGMPAGTTNPWGDTTSANGATQVTSIAVTPGTYLSFSSVSGSSSVVPGTMPYFGPSGSSNYAYGTATHHGENWDGSGSPNGYTENGIADAVMPESSLMGVFLTSAAPNSMSAPATVDWTTPAMQAQTDFNSIQLQQPFYIGDGVSSGGVVQKFLVPPGATRFFIGVWDGEQYNNNAGSISGTVTVQHTVQLVQ